MGVWWGWTLISLQALGGSHPLVSIPARTRLAPYSRPCTHPKQGSAQSACVCVCEPTLSGSVLVESRALSPTTHPRLRDHPVPDSVRSAAIARPQCVPKVVCPMRADPVVVVPTVRPAVAAFPICRLCSGCRGCGVPGCVRCRACSVGLCRRGLRVPDAYAHFPHASLGLSKGLAILFASVKSLVSASFPDRLGMRIGKIIVELVCTLPGCGVKPLCHNDAARLAGR